MSAATGVINWSLTTSSYSFIPTDWNFYIMGSIFYLSSATSPKIVSCGLSYYCYSNIILVVSVDTSMDYVSN
jgi:hypothetical protein